MTEKRIPFNERYPNHRIETRNSTITNMVSAAGWWRINVDSEGISWIEPIAFFATITYEERGVWDGGESKWEKEEMILANSAMGDDWQLEYMDLGNSYNNSRLFYDPDFRLPMENQQIESNWIKTINK